MAAASTSSTTRSAGTTFAASLRCLAPRGHLVSFGQASGDIGSYDIGSLAQGSVTLSRPNYGHFTDTPEALRVHTQRLFAALEEGLVKIAPPRTYRLADAATAHSDLEGRRTQGAIVLLPWCPGQVLDQRRARPTQCLMPML